MATTSPTITYPQRATSSRSLGMLLVRGLLCGVIVVIFSLNGMLNQIAQAVRYAPVHTTLNFLASIPNAIYNRFPISQYFLFEILVRYTLLLFSVFAVLLVLNALRHRTINHVFASVAGLLTGLFIVTWISWLGLACYWITSALLSAFRQLNLVFAFIVQAFLRPPLVYVTITIGLLVAAFYIYSIYQAFKDDIVELFKAILIFLFYAALFVGVLLGLVYFQEWIAWILALLTILVVCVVALTLAVGVLFVLGSQLCDLVVSAIRTGKTTYNGFDTMFGVGAVIALILLISSTNTFYHDLVVEAWSATVPGIDIDVIHSVNVLIPNSVYNFVQPFLAKSSLPLFDLMTVVLALFLASCSMMMSSLSGFLRLPLRGLFHQNRLPPLLYSVGGFLLSTGVAMITPDD